MADKHIAGRMQFDRILSMKQPAIRSITSFLSPHRMLLLAASSIFLIEMFNMAILHYLASYSELSPILEAAIDASLLLLLLTPFYLMIYRPFWDEHQQFSHEVRYLSRELMNSNEMERKRLSRDIHDQCGQTLTALQFEMEVFCKGLNHEDEKQLHQGRKISQMITMLSDDLREVIYRLRPAVLDEIGLIPALQTLTREFTRSHPETGVSESYPHGDIEDSNLSEEQTVAIYRICQESLTNIAKYARASEVNVQLELESSRVSLHVIDNGIGFKKGSRGAFQGNTAHGIGLLGIRERVSDLGGTLDLLTAAGKGTRLSVTIPIQKG